MNSRQATSAHAGPQPVSLRRRCPWCHGVLDGYVFASFNGRRLLALSQFKRVGATEYNWVHSEKGCRVPQLDRINPLRRE